MKKLLMFGACFSIGSPGCAGGQSGGGANEGPNECPLSFKSTSQVYAQFLGRYSSAYALSATDNALCDAEAVGTITVEVSRRNAANADAGRQPDAGRASSAAPNGDAGASTPPPFEPPCGAEWLPVTLDVTLTPTSTAENDEQAQSHSFPALLNEEGRLHWDREDVPEQLPELQQTASGFLHPEQGRVWIGSEALSTIRDCCLEQPTQELSYAPVKARGVVQWELEACAAGKPEELELQFEVERSGPSNPCLASELTGTELVSVHVYNPDGDLLITLPGEAYAENSPLLRVDAGQKTEGLDGLGTAADDQVEMIRVIIEFDPNDADMEPSVALDLYFGFPSAEPPCLMSLDEQRGN